MSISRKLRVSFCLGVLVCSVFMASCQKKGSSDGAASAPLSDEKLLKRGKAIYLSACTACHHTNPAQVGAIGPEVLGASEELLRLKILEGRYPEGYTPKRKTKVMPTQPQLKADISALHRFLKSKGTQ